MTLPIIPFEGRRPYPPRVTELTATFWNGLAQGEWRTTRCRSCANLTFPPKKICPFCWSDSMEWAALATRGTLYSWTQIHVAPAAFRSQAPYHVGIVDLEDGVRLACSLLTTPDLPPRCDAQVEIVALQAEDGPLFVARMSG